MLIKEYKLYMAKKLIRLTEGDLHRIIKESVNKVLMESYFYDDYEKLRRDNLRQNPDAALDDYENNRRIQKQHEINDMWRQHELENGKGLGGGYKYGNRHDMIKAIDGRINNARMGGIKNTNGKKTNPIMRAIHNGRNPDTQKLHTRGSANRDLIAMDKQKNNNKYDQMG